jgi:RNA polymerase sigma-70 factor, ECF subfamily
VSDVRSPRVTPVHAVLTERAVEGLHRACTVVMTVMGDAESPDAGYRDRLDVTPGLLPAMTNVGDGLGSELVGAAAGGDRSAVDDLLAGIRPFVVRYCRAHVGRHERSFASADDVAQEVCLAVLTALPGYQDQGRPFLAFVYGIAARKVADVHRAAARHPAEPVAELPVQAESEAGPERVAERGGLSSRMAAMLRVLPAQQREILVLRVVVGMTAEETAAAVGSTPGAVRVTQHRALATLRRALAAQEVV